MLDLYALKPRGVSVFGYDFLLLKPTLRKFSGQFSIFSYRVITETAERPFALETVALSSSKLSVCFLGVPLQVKANWQISLEWPLVNMAFALIKSPWESVVRISKQSMGISRE